MKNIVKIILILAAITVSNNILKADIPYFVDFKYILNESNAGKGAQKYLKDKLENGIKNIKKKEKLIQDEEKKIIQQKKIISAEEYKKKVTELRNKVSSLKSERNSLLESVSKQRTKARNELLKNLNPIIQAYMKKNSIRMVIDKKAILLADENLDLTKNIIAQLNAKLKTIKLN